MGKVKNDLTKERFEIVEVRGGGSLNQNGGNEHGKQTVVA